MNNEIKINKANKSITFINNGIAFSQFGIADEILDLITNLQQDYDNEAEENLKLSEWLVEKQQRIEGLEVENERLNSQLDFIGEQNKYIDRLEKEYKTINQLTNNWNELKEWLIDYRTNMDNPDIYEEGIIDCLDEVLGKMKEIKEKNNER